MNRHAISARAEAIYAELSQSNVSRQRVKQLSAELDQLETASRTYEKAAGMSSYASPSEFGIDGNPGDTDNGSWFKGLGPNVEHQIRPTSIYAMDKTQIKALQQAAQQGTSFKVQIGSKGIEHGNFAGLRDKAAITEGGLTPSLLPPIQQLGDRGWYSLPYELNRVMNFLDAVAMDGPGIAYFSHTGNAAEAAYTAEGGLKPDTTPTVTENYIRPAKVAGRVNISHELLQDAGDQFGGYLATDLARSVYNAESNLLLNGTTSANGFNGINNVSGTLTQAIGSDTALDCISKAMVALRNDFFEPDILFIHPSTLGAIRRAKDLENRYILQLMEGPRAINQTAETETIWGVQVIQTTQQTAGTAALLSKQSGAAVVYVREALTTFFDPYSQIANNIYQFVAETRIALATPRPNAICLISGLPTS